MNYLVTNQNNFASIPYPSATNPNATVKSAGCGPCAVLNVIENTTSERWKMADWIRYVIAAGGRINGGTSIPKILDALKKDYGFDYSTTNSAEVVKKHLADGNMAVLLVGGTYNLLSTEPHYLCLADTDGNDAILIDPGWYSGKYSSSFRRARVKSLRPNGVIRVAWSNVELDKKYTRSHDSYFLITAPGKSEPSEGDIMRFKTMDDVPNYGKKVVQKLLDKNYLQGTGDNTLDITEDMLRIFVILDRVGLL